MKTDMGFSEMQEYIWRLERRFVEDKLPEVLREIT